MVIFEDLFNDIFDALYGDHYLDGDLLYKNEYYWECIEFEEEIRRFYINVNDKFELDVKDIVKQILYWESSIGGELNINKIKLYDAADKILGILKERKNERN